MLVRDNRSRFRFELLDGDELAGLIDYRVREGRHWLVHTEIRDRWQGTGAASLLVRSTLDQLRERGATIVPTCPFVAGWIRRHPDYDDLIDHETLRVHKRSRNAGRRRLATPAPFDPDGTTVGTACAHVPADPRALPAAWPDGGCAECLTLGHRDWVHLRRCVSCGHVGCCDSSPGRHATRHHEQSAHPLVCSHEPGESWWFCYVDVVTFDVSVSTATP